MQVSQPYSKHLTAARPARRASSVRSAPLKPSVCLAKASRSTSAASGARRSAARSTASRPASSGSGTCLTHCHQSQAQPKDAAVVRKTSMVGVHCEALFT